jgi:hypothetical protein
MWRRAEQRTHLDQVPRGHLLAHDLPSKPLRVSFGRIALVLQKKGQGM